MTQETSTTPGINLQDLATAVQAIDMGSAKGSYTGIDMEIVGAARNRIAAFVNANAQKEQPSEENIEE